MPRVGIDVDEWYPVYDIYDGGNAFEVPSTLIKRHKKALKEFNEVQVELANIYKKDRDA